MQPYADFLTAQQLLTIATHSETDLWIANVYFASDEQGNLYFISPKDTTHSLHLLENPQIAFSTAWFNPSNHQNRKSIQGVGACTIAPDLTSLTKGISLLYTKFPDLHEVLTVDWILHNAWGTKVWMIVPERIKYWDDELYKDEESEEFIFAS